MQRSYRFGNERIGVRTTSSAFGQWLDLALSHYRCRGRELPSYSVVIGRSPRIAGEGRGIHVLYAGVTPLVRTRRLFTLAQVLLAELETYEFGDRDDAVFVHCGLVSMNGMTALVPSWMVTILAAAGHRRLERAGLGLPVAPAVAVDTASGRVLPARSRLRIPDGIFEALCEMDPSGPNGERSAVQRPIAVDVVVSIQPDLQSVAPVPRSLALHSLMAEVANLEAVGSRALGSLGMLVEGATCVGLGQWPAQDVVHALSHVFSEAAA